jgi:PAS domain S-box-containing protein
MIAAADIDRPKVLIVDDQPRNLDVLEAMLEPLGCAFVRAQSADEALLGLLRHDFAAIILDIRMPGMGGIELATLIKQRKRSQHVPILFLTAHVVEEEDVLRGYGVGAVDYLSKPINAEILRSKIGVFVELFRKTRTLGELNEALQREAADREQAQEALWQANQELEQRVQERTAELTRVHRGVAENELRLRLAIEVASMGAWEWHLASDRMTWSTDPEALFGFPRGSFGDDLRISGLLHPEDKAAIDQAMTSALSTGMYQAEYRAVRPDGSIVWLADRGRVVSDVEGKPERMVGITRNITLERQAVQEREALLRDARESRDEAEAASRAKDEFLAMLSHELRNPLNVIAVGLSLLDSAGSPDDPHGRTRQLISKQVRHLTRLMDDLLDIARVSSGKILLNRQPVNLAATVDRCLAAIGETGIPGRHSWRKSLAPVWINADETRIEQIVTNLIANATKFTPAGGQIDVAVSVDGGDALLRITDGGVGIEPELLPRIFDLFVQGDRSMDRAQGGLGLGLTLVRRLTEMHDGSVAAASDGPGRGASFVVRVPRILPLPSGQDAPAGSTTMARRRILVVEDNPDGRELLRAMLQVQGHEVHDAPDGESAIAKAREVHPDAAIIDIGLPGIDGYAVATRLREMGMAVGTLQLIALTGYGTEEDRRRARAAGFDAHLTKPVEPEALSHLLTRSRLTADRADPKGRNSD